MRVRDVGVLGRLVRWRIPGTPPDLAFDQLFRQPPFIALEDGAGMLISGLVGRIWTLRRDYPHLAHPDEFRDWSERGTVRVVFANWVRESPRGAVLTAEARSSRSACRGGSGCAPSGRS